MLNNHLKKTLLISSLIVCQIFFIKNAYSQSNFQPNVEVVFVLDTTSSMTGLINSAKQKIWAIANTLSKTEPAPKIKIGLLGYRDKGDTYITKLTQLNEDLDQVYKELMQFQAQGGGDAPESVNLALHDAVTKIQWSQNKEVYKVIYLVGDAPPHMDYQDDIKYQDTCKLAKKMDIVINTIQCGNWPSTESYWKDIAVLARGEYFKVSQSGSAITYETPFDDELAGLSRDLDKTKVYYGEKKDLDEAKTRIKTSEEIYKKADKIALAQRSAFNAKGTGLKNFLGKNELVDEVINNKIRLENIKKDNLPGFLQKLSPEERKKYILSKSVERKKIQKKIISLSNKRQLYLENKIKSDKDGGRDSLDNKLYKTIQKQAAEKNIKYKNGACY